MICAISSLLKIRITLQIVLVLGGLRLSRTVLDKFPDMLSAQMLGRLLPEIHEHAYIRQDIYLYIVKIYHSLFMNKNIKSISDKHSFCLFPGSFWFNVIPRGFFTIAWFLYGIIFRVQAALSNIPWKVIVLPFSVAVSAQINVMWFLSQTSKYVSIS